MAASFIDHLRHNSARFREVLSDAPAGARVPTCPDWNADDLLWHLGEVQWFWGTIVSRDLRHGEEIHALIHPGRPASRAGLLDFFDSSTVTLAETLEQTPVDQPRWMWAYDPELHNVDYIRRRQSHEALIHRIDAELAADTPIAPIDPDLAADGVDEILSVMFAGAPEWADFAAHDGQVVRVHAVDSGDSWLLQLGELTGKDPQSRESIDEAGIQVLGRHSGTPTATITGSAADLDCWLWGRPPAAPLTSTGDQATLQAFGKIVAEGLQ